MNGSTDDTKQFSSTLRKLQFPLITPHTKPTFYYILVKWETK